MPAAAHKIWTKNGQKKIFFRECVRDEHFLQYVAVHSHHT